MSDNLTTLDRVVLLLALVPYLREHGPTSVASLADVFEVEAETIRSLVTFLGTAGVPGETFTYQPEDLFDIDWDAFELHDVVSLTSIVAVDDTPRFAATEYAALLAGLQVLRAILPEDERAIAASAATKLALAAPGQGGEAPQMPSQTPSISVTTGAVDPQLSLLYEALEQRRRISFEYRDLQGASSLRTVEPLALNEAGGTWYLRAFCLDRRAERTFLVDAMRGSKMLGSRARRRGVTGGILPASEPPDADLIASLRVRERAQHRIASFRPRILGEAEPGWLRAEVKLVHPGAAVRLVQAAPGDVVVEDPPAARAAVCNWVERALAQADLTAAPSC